MNVPAGSVDISGLRLTDDPAAPNKFTFPAGTFMDDGDGTYLTLYANNADGTPGFHLGFSLGANGDAIYLFNRVSSGGALLDSVQFGLQLPNLSISRLGAGGDWSLSQPTLGAANVAQALGSCRPNCTESSSAPPLVTRSKR